MTMGDRHATALIFIRTAVAALMFIHGATRISNGTVGGFGEFLGSQGVPFGFYAAWTITLFELIGSVMLAVGFYAWLIALIFAIHLLVGVALVHWESGWFVVGSGRNGMEFSFLLIASFLALAYAGFRRDRG